MRIYGTLSSIVSMILLAVVSVVVFLILCVAFGKVNEPVRPKLELQKPATRAAHINPRTVA